MSAAAQRLHAERTGRAPTVAFFAPGRVNLIGEHTDYNDGFVFPFAIERGTVVAASPRSDGLVRAYSHSLNEERTLDPQAPFSRSGGWTDYLAGVIVALGRKMRFPAAGADLTIVSDLPLGAGLSSSASFELSCAGALAALAGGMDALDLAETGRIAEHEFAGVRSGIMDQLAAALGQAGNALLIDCRSSTVQTVAVPARAAFIVCDTKVKHSLASSEYNVRRNECEEAARILGVASLRDVDARMLEEKAALLPGAELNRAKHVVGENARTLAAAETLRQGDLASCGSLMNASHESLRTLFEVSCPELDEIVAIARETPGVFGARMTGGGFGGSAIILTEGLRTQGVVDKLTERYYAAHALEPAAYVVHASQGARLLNTSPV